MRLVEFLNITETPDAFLQDFKGIRGQLGKQGVDITITKLDDRTVELDNIDVSPAFRGRGLGTKAMNALIALADKHNTRIFLYPLEDNEEDIDLQDWYGRLGFSHYADQVHGIYMLYDPSGGLSTNPIREAKFRKPVVMYHGTSNAHIRSILKRGIIPEPVEKVWATDPDLSPHSFSRASLRGSYWSANLGTASSSSTTATYQKHFGGSPLIVVAQISEGSAYADEDDLNFQINWAMGNMYHDLFGGDLISEAVPKASALYYWGEGKQNEMIQSFGEALHESASIDPKKQPIDWSFMEELLKAIMLRQLAYEVFEQERSKSYYKDVYVREMQRLQGEGKAPPIPSIEEAENILLRLREILTRMYRKTVYPEKSQSVLRNTLRTAQPVTYRGANKILAILGDQPREKSDKGSEWWEKPKILYYGSPPEDYFKQYREFMGSFPGAVNTKGQMVIQPDEKKKVAASIGEAESSKDFDFGYDVTGAHHGQVDGVAYAYDSDSKVVYGLINWSSFEDETYINHIEVNPKFQRQGLATRMIAFLKDKNDNESINWGMTTPEGTEFRKAIGEEQR